MSHVRPDITPPQSYTTLPLKDILVSHHPASSPTATPVIVVTLNRPKQRNAYTLQMMEDFELLYPMLDVDERVKCIVLTGAGTSFCSGADLGIGFPKQEERFADHRDRFAFASFLSPELYRLMSPLLPRMFLSLST